MPCSKKERHIVPFFKHKKSHEMILRGTHKFDISITSNIATIYYPKNPFDYPFQTDKLDKYPVSY